MTETETLVDYITGAPVPNVGAEANRQAVERLLVETKGFDKSQVSVDVPITVAVDGETYRSRVDLVVSVDGTPRICIKCAPGSLGSRERETLAAARLLGETPVPLSIVSDGRTAIVMETVTGRKLGEGLDAVPPRAELTAAKTEAIPALTPERKRREAIIFRSYDSMTVNRPPL